MGIVLLLIVFLLEGGDSYFKRGMHSLNEGRILDAINDLNKSIEGEPAFRKEALRWLGFAYHKKGEHALAIGTLKEVLEKNPHDLDCQIHLSEIYFELGNLEDALQELKRAVEMAPDSARPHYNLGTVYEKQQRWDDAIRELKRAFSLQPRSRTLKTLGDICLRLRRYEELQEACERNSEDGTSHYYLGLVYLKRNRLKEAEEEFRRALQLEIPYGEAHYSLGLVHLKRNEWEDALREFQMTVKLIPGHIGGHFNLGNAYLRLREREKGVQELEIFKRLRSNEEELNYYILTVVQKQPPRPEFQATLGELYMRALRFSEAREAYYTALQMDPDHSRAREGLQEILVKEKELDQP